MSLSSTAVLVEFAVRMPRWAKKADDLAEETAANHGADADMHAHTELTLDKNAWSDLAKWEANTREWYRSMSVPFSDAGKGKGMRLMGAAAVAKFDTEMKNRIDDGRNIMQNFVDNNYDKAVADARFKRGDRFDINDYPTKDAVRKSFKVTYRVLNAPDIGALPTLLQGIVGAGSQVAIDAAVANTKRVVFARLRKPIAHMHDKLSNYGGKGTGRKGSFHDSLTENIAEILDMLPALNVDNDPTIDAMAKLIKDDLLAYSAEELRENEFIRADVAEKAETLVKTADAMVASITAKMDDFV